MSISRRRAWGDYVCQQGVQGGWIAFILLACESDLAEDWWILQDEKEKTKRHLAAESRRACLWHSYLKEERETRGGGLANYAGRAKGQRNIERITNTAKIIRR